MSKAPRQGHVAGVEMTEPAAARGRVMSKNAESVRHDVAVAAVRRLHSQRTFDGDGYGWAVCAECRQAWPCATERAILASYDESPIDGSGAAK